MSLRGRCIICTSAFTQTTVFALPCGHTFHEQCIGQWLTTPGRGCPNCRRKCAAKDVTRIFFENGGLNDTLNVTTQESGEEALLAKNEELQAVLNDLAAEAKKAKKDLSVEKYRRIELETLVATERKAAQQAAQKLKAGLLQVRPVLHDVNAIVSCINAGGDPDSGKFMELQSRYGIAFAHRVLSSATTNFDNCMFSGNLNVRTGMPMDHNRIRLDDRAMTSNRLINVQSSRLHQSKTFGHLNGRTAMPMDHNTILIGDPSLNSNRRINVQTLEFHPFITPGHLNDPMTTQLLNSRSWQSYRCDN